MIKLLIKPKEEKIANFYKNSLRKSEDLGYDLYLPEDISIPPLTISCIDHKIQAEMYNDTGNIHYFLVPRSSIYKHGLMQVNSIGIIDKGYRGSLKAMVYNTTNEWVDLSAGERLFQLIVLESHSIDFIGITQKLSNSERGEGGFGSTGR